MSEHEEAPTVNIPLPTGGQVELTRADLLAGLVLLHQGAQDLPFLKECLINGEDRCPKCGSHEVEGRFIESGSGEATQTMDCIDCELSWVDGYHLTGISVIHE